MFGTREELCAELERMFEADDALVLLLWTEEGMYAACREYGQNPQEEEIHELMKVIGSTPMDVYRSEGVTKAGISDLLSRHRTALNRQVNVPAGVLARLLQKMEGDLIHEEGIAWENGKAPSDYLKRMMEDIQLLRMKLAA